MGLFVSIELGTGYISLTAETKQLVRDITKQVGDAAERAGSEGGGKAGDGFLATFREKLGGVGKVLAASFAGVAAGSGIFLKGAIEQASSLNEAASKVGVVFGDNAKSIQEFAKSSARDFGLSASEALGAAGTYGNLFRAMGIGTDVAADMSKQLVKNAADLASFNDANPNDVLLALRSGLSSETEPLKTFGININDARLKAEAFRLGLVDAVVDQDKLSAAQETADKAARKVAESLKKYGADSVQYTDAVRDQEQAESKLAGVMEGKVPDALTAAQKAQAAYSLIQQDSTLAADDFARTSGSVANQGRQLSATFKDLQGKIGTAFLPIVSAAAAFLLDKVLPALGRLGDQVKPAMDTLIESVKAFAPTLQTIGNGVLDLAQWLRDVDWTAFLQPVVDFVGVLVSGIADLALRLRDVDWGAVFSRAREFVQPVITFVQVLAEQLVIMAAKLREVDWAAAFDRVERILTPIVRGFNDLKDAVFATATDALPVLQGVFDYLIDTAFPALSDVAQTVAPIVEQVFKVLADLVGLLGDHMDTLAPILITVGAGFAGFKAATSVASNVSDLSEKLVKFTTVGTDAGQKAGSLSDSFTKIKENLSSVSDNFKGGFEGIKNSVNGAKASVQSFASASWSKIKAGFSSIATSAKAAATALVGYIKQTALWIKQAVIATATAIKQAAVWVAQKVAMIATTVATQAMAAAQWLLNAAMNANPIGLIIAGVIALGAALVLAYNKSETFRNIVDAIGRFFRDTLWPAIVDIATAIGGFFAGAFSTAKDIVAAAIGIYIAYVTTVWDVIKVVGGVLLDVFRTAWSVVESVAGVIRDVLATAFDHVRIIIDTVWPVIQTVVGWLEDRLKEAIDTASTGISTLINWFGWLIDGAKNVYDRVKESFDSIVSFISGLPGRITSMASGMWDSIKDGFKSVINWIIDKWNGLEFSVPKIDVPFGPDIGGFTIGTPKIPRLANGGVITEPTLALMGEVTRARPEIATPEALMRDIFRDELSTARSGGPLIHNEFNAAQMSANEVSASLAWQLRTLGVGA